MDFRFRRRDLISAQQRVFGIVYRGLTETRSYVLAALMMAFANAPTCAGGCGSHIVTTKIEEPAPSIGA